MKALMATGLATIASALTGGKGTQSNIVAAPHASPIVHTFVGRVNDHIMTPAIRYQPTGQGTARRMKREAADRLAKSKMNKKLDAIAAKKPKSRQVRRAEDRAEDREFLSFQKHHAMKDKIMGGSAVVVG